MMKFVSNNRRTLALIGILAPLLSLFAYVAVSSGPLAPVPVTVVKVEKQEITPSLFGIGIVEARYTHKIGPTAAGRVLRVNVQPGDRVQAGQLLGEMDPVDLEEKIQAQQAAVKRAEAGVAAAKAQIQEVKARMVFAETQAERYEKLFHSSMASRETVDAKQQELHIIRAARLAAEANRDVSHQELARLQAELDGLARQRMNLRLVSPVDGLVTRRDADPGTTVIAGSPVIEVVEPNNIWINVRFDQQRATGLQPHLPAQILLRSQAEIPLAGIIARIEPHADPVTEETLAKVEFIELPNHLPPIGELAEVTVALAAQKAMPVIPNAGVQRVDGRLGVWMVEDDRLRFMPIELGAADLEGRVQILAGLNGGEHVVAYSQKALNTNSRIKVVDRILEKSL